ncbi:hypothetical protein ACTXT7_005867 [Hymenolepis weldensis]
MLAYEQLHIPPRRQRKSYCQKCSLCCCRCCLGTSILFGTIFAVAGGLLIYAFREDSFDRFSNAIGYYSEKQQYSFMMISSSNTPKLISSKKNQVGRHIVVSLTGNSLLMNIIHGLSFQFYDVAHLSENEKMSLLKGSFQISTMLWSNPHQPGDILTSPRTAIPKPSAPPLEPPPSYESIAQEKA